jgi:hypothetical protein
VPVAAPKASGIPIWAQKVITRNLGPDEYLAVADIDMDTYFSLIDKGYLENFKPVGSGTVIPLGKGPGGLRAVEVNGQIKFVLNDLDAAFYVRNNQLVPNEYFINPEEGFMNAFNRSSPYELMQHGPKLNGYLLGMKGTSPATLDEIVYIFSQNGYVGSGRMSEMADLLMLGWQFMRP